MGIMIVGRSDCCFACGSYAGWYVRSISVVVLVCGIMGIVSLLEIVVVYVVVALGEHDRWVRVPSWCPCILPLSRSLPFCFPSPFLVFIPAVFKS